MFSLALYFSTDYTLPIMSKKLTTRQAAELLGVSPSRVRQFVMRFQLPAEYFGRDLMIDERDLELVKERKHGRPPKEREKAA